MVNIPPIEITPSSYSARYSSEIPIPNEYKYNWIGLYGKPYITVSAKGLANGLSTIFNDGADFGPDTPLNNDISSGQKTQTSGIQEAINYLPTAEYLGQGGNIAIGNTGNVRLLSSLYTMTGKISIPVGSILNIQGLNTPSAPAWFGQGYNTLPSITTYTGGSILYFDTSVSYPVFDVPQNSNGDALTQLFIENVQILVENPSSYTNSIAVDLSGISTGGGNHFYVYSTATTGTGKSTGNGNIDTGVKIERTGGDTIKFTDMRISGFASIGIDITSPNTYMYDTSIAYISNHSTTGGAITTNSLLLDSYINTHLFYCSVGINIVSQGRYEFSTFYYTYFESVDTPANITLPSVAHTLPVFMYPLFTVQATSSSNNFTGDIVDGSKAKIMYPMFYGVSPYPTAYNTGLGFGTPTPSLPGGTGSGNSVLNDYTYSVVIYQTGESGTTIVDPYGNTQALPSDPSSFILDAGASVYYATTVPSTWIWYGNWQ